VKKSAFFLENFKLNSQIFLKPVQSDPNEQQINSDQQDEIVAYKAIIKNNRYNEVELEMIT
jgi:hypothetical protein